MVALGYYILIYALYTYC